MNRSRVEIKGSQSTCQAVILAGIRAMCARTCVCVEWNDLMAGRTGCQDILYHQRLVAVAHQQVGGVGVRRRRDFLCVLLITCSTWPSLLTAGGPRLSGRAFKSAPSDAEVAFPSLPPTSPAHWRRWISAEMLTISSQP